eukprot:4682234-Prymnesium_polylepis.1
MTVSWWGAALGGTPGSCDGTRTSIRLASCFVPSIGEKKAPSNVSTPSTPGAVGGARPRAASPAARAP